MSRNRTTPHVRNELEKKVYIDLSCLPQIWRQSQIGRSHSYPQILRELTFDVATIMSCSLPCYSLRESL